jgi:hypothetical protein
MPNDSIFIVLILVKSLPARGAIKRKMEIMMVNITPSVIAAATLFGIENFLMLIAVSLSINGLPISESTAEIIMYITISLKYHAMKPIIRKTAIPIMYFAS